MYAGIHLFLISIPLGPWISPVLPFQLLCSFMTRVTWRDFKAILRAHISNKDVKRIYTYNIKIRIHLLFFLVQETLKKS